MSARFRRGDFLVKPGCRVALDFESGPGHGVVDGGFAIGPGGGRHLVDGLFELAGNLVAQPVGQRLERSLELGV